VNPRTLMLLGAFAALIAGGVAVAEQTYVVKIEPRGAPKGFQKISVSRATVGDKEIRIWANAAINPDCTEHPGVALSVVTPPAHGAVRLVEEPIYMAYPAANPRSTCNDRKVPGREAFYTAAARFTGHDHLVLQGVQPEGIVRRIAVDIDVR
jgi:hypothetical protein